MSAKIPTREEAFTLLLKYNKSESLIKHALAVEGVMRYCARKRGEDEEKWGIIGLVHDLDYEKFPKEHCSKSKEILESSELAGGVYVRAVISHGWGICSEVEPVTRT
jgi:predicted hydrolase (HD superfamily)